MNNRLYHRRLPDWEAFDEITMRVIPRYKTSGLSGDEWRQHVEIEFFHKGQIVYSAGSSTMEAAILMLGTHFIKQQEPIPERVIEIESETCDQPSCREKAVGRYMPKKLTAKNGDWLDMGDQRLHYYRKFCKAHARRGDCSREDCDENYEPLDGLKPDDSSNVHESPSVFGGVIAIDGPSGEGEVKS